ncbi:hypothetical protein C1893_01700 [Pseudomonas sp. MPR-ANC1]|uniref:hypothetical protein n=1 Tax=Pseudomonas sp. MPR-ANC1 TaxID=2075548 RepID=UPI000CD0DBD9|nr:hypothetical protein [Pseudomonas sp. MPR-ANC1]POA50291.1 hypothetical protein C1893_01700 [Pseudomonas sp. MPR-ANC1]
MALVITQAPKLDLDGTRWVDIDKGVRLKIGSAGNPKFKSHHALILRHQAAVDSRYGVGTEGFDPSNTEIAEIESMDDMLVDLVCKHLILDWEGVEEADAPGVDAEYTQERGKLLIAVRPDVYFLALKTGSDIAMRAEEKTKETVGKPSRRTNGAGTGQARKTRKSAGSTNA